MKNKSPIIIIGMHRSGTTMLTKLLEQFGLFVGYKKRKNFESTYFQKLNKWLLFQANTSWDFPSNIKYIDEDYLNCVRPIILNHLSSLFRIEYLGLKKAIKYKSLNELPFKWAWKDPVNSITIDVWKAIFPEAKIIYVYRNPIDVAQSLKIREEKRRKNRKISKSQKFKQYLLVNDYQFNQSYYIQDLKNGVELWKNYVLLNEESVKKYPNDIIKIKYEDLLENPNQYLKEILNFIDMQATDAMVKEVSSMIDSTRKFGFVKEPDLWDFYQTIKDESTLVKMGYDRISK